MAQHFIRTPSGEYVNASRIVSMRRHSPQQTVVVIDSGDGSSPRQDVIDDSVDALATRLSGAIVPAEAGHYTVRFWPGDGSDGDDGSDGGGGWIEKLAVVAWRVADGQAFPVTIDSPDETMIDSVSRRYVLTPSGEVEDPGNRTWSSLASWQADMRKKAKDEPR